MSYSFKLWDNLGGRSAYKTKNAEVPRKCRGAEQRKKEIFGGKNENEFWVGKSEGASINSF